MQQLVSPVKQCLTGTSQPAPHKRNAVFPPFDAPVAQCGHGLRVQVVLLAKHTGSQRLRCVVWIAWYHALSDDRPRVILFIDEVYCCSRVPVRHPCNWRLGLAVPEKPDVSLL